MKNLHIIAALFFAACCGAAPATAQEYADTVMVEAPVVEEESTGDETEISANDDPRFERRYMDEYQLEALRRKKEFQYPDMDSIAAADSVYIEPPRPPARRPKNEFKGFDGSILLWLVVAIAVVVIVLQIVGINMRQLFSSGKVVKGETADDMFSNNIHEIPYESAIQQAILAGNYSLATRLMYLQALKMLSDKNLIIWHQNKTNWQYVYELKNEKLRNGFRDITHIFEYVQYGHMPLSGEKFGIVQETFSNFKKQVS